MKLIFNDATEITVQQVEPRGDCLRILVVGTTPEQLKVLFTDTSRTALMTVQERGQTIATYEGYTAFYRTEIYTGKIYGVVMYKQETLPEVQSQMVQAAVLVAQMQAHTSQTDWAPDTAPSLFAEVLPGQDGTEIGEWVQPGSTNPYMTGDRVTHNGKTWESLVDNNVWEPGVQGSGALWQEVTE